MSSNSARWPSNLPSSNKAVPRHRLSTTPSSATPLSAPLATSRHPNTRPVHSLLHTPFLGLLEAFSTHFRTRRSAFLISPFGRNPPPKSQPFSSCCELRHVSDTASNSPRRLCEDGVADLCHFLDINCTLDWALEPSRLQLFPISPSSHTHSTVVYSVHLTPIYYSRWGVVCLHLPTR